MNLNEWDISEKVLGGAGVVGMLVIGLQKAISFFRAEQVLQKGSTASVAQYAALMELIESLQADNSDLRTQFHMLDAKLHKQQTKLTRTEMLVRQFVGLVKQNGIVVPAYMQDELDDLLKPERPPDVRTRATDKE